MITRGDQPHISLNRGYPIMKKFVALTVFNTVFFFSNNSWAVNDGGTGEAVKSHGEAFAGVLQWFATVWPF
jgi:hypothetical protein